MPFTTSTLEVLSLPSEEGVSTQLTLQRTIEHLDALAVTQANLIEVLELIGQDPRRRACIIMLETLADHTIKLFAVTQAQTFAVGRIGDDERRSFGSRALLHRTMAHGDEVSKPRHADVVARHLHGFDGAIRTINMVLEGL